MMPLLFVLMVTSDAVTPDAPFIPNTVAPPAVIADDTVSLDASSDPSGLTKEDRARMDPLGEESCKWTVGDQTAKTEEARRQLTAEPKILAYLILKQPALDNALCFRGVWGVLNPLREKALPFYAIGLNHPSKAVRQATLNMLSQADVPMEKCLRSPLLRLLRDEDHFSDVLEVLTRFKDDSAMVEALGRLKPGEPRRILVGCVMYVSKLGGQAAARSLMNLLGDERFEVRAAVCAALGSLGEAAHAPLRELLTSSDRRLRLAAIEALALAHCSRECLDPLLLDDDRIVKAAAARALLTLGAPREELARVLKAEIEDPLIAGALAH